MNIKRHSFLILLLFSFSGPWIYTGIYAGSEPKRISFQQLEGLKDYFTQEIAIRHLERDLAEFQGKPVQMRGFLLYGSDAHQKKDLGILTSVLPGKSCCPSPVRSPAQLVFLDRSFEGVREGSVVTVKGIFEIEPIWNSEGSLVQLYHLKEATLLIPTQLSWEQLAAGVFGGVAVLGVCCALVLIIKNRRELVHE